LDISQPFDPPSEWKHPDLLVHCASSGGGGAEAYRGVYRDGMANLLEAFAPGRGIFTGSTSVYDQQEGEWVDENSPTEPPRETGKILLEAEAIARRAGDASSAPNRDQFQHRRCHEDRSGLLFRGIERSEYPFAPRLVAKAEFDKSWHVGPYKASGPTP
jgi:hypothetical protein